MKTDKETKAKLLDSAKKEFLEKGYMQASLRNICKNAGVTTGALYFFFQDKEDLFASLVEKPLKKLYEVMNQHYMAEILQAEQGLARKEDNADDFKAAKEVVHYMYQYYDAFQLILAKGQGSRFEQTVDRFVEITEKHYRRLADQMTEAAQTERIDDYMIHWIAHMQIDVFVHMIIHEKSEEAALQHMEPIVQFLITGWMGMFQSR